MNSSQKKYTLADLISELDVTLQGDPNCLINGVCPIQQSQPGCITFLTNSLYQKHLKHTEASAVILSEANAAACPAHVHAVISRNPYYTYAKIASYFDNKMEPASGVHAAAVIGQRCTIHPSASIAATCVIGNDVIISAHAIIGPGVVIGDHSEIGEATCIDANATLYHRVKIGKRVHIASGVIIGTDGFGFANQAGQWHKVPQLGGVHIGDDVDIGANTCIDRGALEDTILENGVKLDNLIQVGHNVKIGANTLICGCVAIAGSTVIGKNCTIGGSTNFAGHLTVCDNTMITGSTDVTKSITEPGIYSSGIVGAVTNHEFRKNNARFHRLDNLMQRVKVLESALKELTERNAS